MAQQPNNPWLPPQHQGRKFRVRMVVVQPRITLLDDDGKDDGEFPAQAVAWYESAWGKTLPKFLAGLRLDIEAKK